MLKRLRVENLALVERAAVDFEVGLNTVTGETGAGKSVFIGALKLLHGERGDAGAVRSGTEQALVEAVFTAGRRVEEFLAEAGLPACEEGELILRRTVKSGGGGHAWVNDSPVTLGTLKRLGVLLIELHGAHDHQLLLQAGEQLRMLDAYAKDETERAAYGEAWRRRNVLEAERRRLAEEGSDGEELAGRIELLEERIKEVSEADPKAGEEAELREELETAGQAQRVLELGQAAVQGLTEGEGCALDVLGPVRKALEELGRLMPGRAGEWGGELKGLSDGLASLSMRVQRELADVEADEDRLEWLDRRLCQYARLRRKYGEEPERLPERMAGWKAKLAELKGRDGRLEELEGEIAAAEKEMERTGKALRKKREAAARRLGPSIEGELRALGFAGGRFEIAVKAAEAPGAEGLDEVEFGFAPNAGEPMRPLRAIASSGEMSRVMLSAKIVLAEADEVGAMVFDEIDANVGGETAFAVAEKLTEAAEGRQVLVITHLPAVAAMGRVQFAVEKGEQGGRTRTVVRRLEEGEREGEIARMLGGRDLATAVAHARELLGRRGGKGADGKRKRTQTARR